MQYGVALTSASNQFRVGERVLLAAFVRNISDKSQHIDLRPEMVWNVPQVINSDGTVMKIEKRAMLGTIHPYRETLAPSEVFGPLYLNVGPGDNPRPPLQNWFPWIAAPAIGKYQLTHSIPLQVADSNAPRDGKDTVWTTGKLTSGKVEFGISERFAVSGRSNRVVVSAQQGANKDTVVSADTAVPTQNTHGLVNSSGTTSLPEGLEEHLDWSEPVGGLRAAVMIRSLEALGILGKERRIFLIVQNVSDQAVRFCDTAIHETDVPAADVEGRKLYLKRNGEIMFALQNAKSTTIDIVMQTREVLSIDLFDNEKPREKGPKVGDAMSEGIVKDPYQSLFAVLSIVHAPEGAWTGKLKTPTTRSAFTADGKMPKSKEGQELFRYCIDHARLGGDIPGRLISRLHDLVQEFIRNNAGDQSGDPYAKKMQPLLTRFEHKGDWKQSDAVALFDDIAIVTTIPLERTMEIIRENTLQRGQQLATSQQDVHWGEALPGGLRMAWILEPRENKYHVRSSLKSRVVLHNSGNEPVIFVTRSFQQPPHTAVTANGVAVKMESTYWTTHGRPEPYRLHPGESCEIHAPGLASESATRISKIGPTFVWGPQFSRKKGTRLSSSQVL